jgi:UDP-N-acetylglucosamine 2-epimerase (non-hydrolysing)
LRLLPQADMMWDKLSGMYSLRDREFGLVTLHRVGNVDDPEILSMRFNTLLSISHTIPLVFPIHPRTRARLRGVIESKEGMLLLEPQGYLQFLCLQRHARFVITDSGGIQEETTFLKVPCITLRKNTERPITVTRGTNCLVGDDMQLLLATISSVLSGNEKRGSIPPLWDGKAGERIACSLSDDVE